MTKRQYVKMTREELIDELKIYRNRMGGISETVLNLLKELSNLNKDK